MFHSQWRHNRHRIAKATLRVAWQAGGGSLLMNLMGSLIKMPPQSS
jgi:hypothetical protein